MNSLDIMRALCGVSEEIIDLRFDDDTESSNCVQQIGPIASRTHQTYHVSAKPEITQSPNRSIDYHTGVFMPYIIAAGCLAACFAGLFFLIRSDYSSNDLTAQSGSQDVAVTQLIPASSVKTITSQSELSTGITIATPMQSESAVIYETVTTSDSIVLQTAGIEKTTHTEMSNETELLTTNSTAAETTSATSNTSSIALESTTLSSVSSTHIIENSHEIPFWDEKSFGEKYTIALFVTADGETVNYLSQKQTVQPEQIAEYLGKVQLTGFDVYTDDSRYCESKAYRIRDNDSMIAIKSNEDDFYYSYVSKIPILTTSTHSEDITASDN